MHVHVQNGVQRIVSVSRTRSPGTKWLHYFRASSGWSLASGRAALKANRWNMLDNFIMMHLWIVNQHCQGSSKLSATSGSQTSGCALVSYWPKNSKCWTEWLLSGWTEWLLPASHSSTDGRWIGRPSCDSSWCLHSQSGRAGWWCCWHIGWFPLPGQELPHWVPCKKVNFSWFLTMPFPVQGISRAGAQRSMKDDRSSLVTQPFRLWDEWAARGKPLRLEMTWTCFKLETWAGYIVFHLSFLW